MPIYYWPPLIFVMLAPLLLADRVPIALQLALPLTLIIPLSAYIGSQSDWETYREFVLACDQPGCTYFEPGFDRLVYLASETVGFSLLEVVLWLCIVISFRCLRMIFPDVNPIILIITLYSAYFALYLGAIRQSITSAFFLMGLTLYMRSQRAAGGALTLAGGLFHLSGFIAVAFLGAVSVARRMQLFSAAKNLAAVFLVTAASYLFFDYLSGSLPRLGETNIGTDYVANDAFGFKDILIAAERLAFLVLSVQIVTRRDHPSAPLLFALQASAFIIFFSLAIIDRNIAGRTIAFLRIADVIVLWLGFESVFGKTPRILILLAYIVTKQYFTIVSVGFFDD